MERDSATVVSWLKNLSLHLVIHIPHVQDFQRWLATVDVYEISHIFWEANQVANFMANRSLQGDFTWSYDEILDHHAIYLLQANAHGIFYNR